MCVWNSKLCVCDATNLHLLEEPLNFVMLFISMLKFIIWHIYLDKKVSVPREGFSSTDMTVFRCQFWLSGEYLLFSFLYVAGMSSCRLLLPQHLCFFFYISGVKRGVCSQINHFPEDADFDHDGAEYVLRKSISALTDIDVTKKMRN